MRQYIPHPTLPEQQAIAGALSDIDALISAQEELLAKKRAIKQGAMQELLTGRRRLSGFTVRPMKQTDIGPIPEDWEVKELGEMFIQVLGGGTPSRAKAEYWHGDQPWATVKDISHFSPVDTQEHISSNAVKYSSTRIIPAGTPIVTMRMSIGKVVIYQVDVAINQDLKALFICDRASVAYTKYVIESISGLLEDLASGSTVKGLPLPVFTKYLVAVPSLSEQEAIAAVLSDMDAEITALEEELEKQRALKRGMMQELLCGRIRLPYNKPTHRKQHV